VPAAATLADHQREQDFQAQITDLADLLGWVWWHDNDPLRNRAGWPDLFLIRERMIFAEVKTQRGQPTAAQTAMLGRLRDAGAEVYLWRPSDWDQIVHTLTARRATP
jgi:hypothetical protein